MTNPHVEYLAHHWIVLAAPAFLPAVIVVGVVLYVAIRDRRAGRSPATRRAGTVDQREDGVPPAGGATPDNSNRPTDAAGDKRD